MAVVGQSTLRSVVPIFFVSVARGFRADLGICGKYYKVPRARGLMKSMRPSGLGSLVGKCIILKVRLSFPFFFFFLIDE